MPGTTTGTGNALRSPGAEVSALTDRYLANYTNKTSSDMETMPQLERRIAWKGKLTEQSRQQGTRETLTLNSEKQEAGRQIKNKKGIKG